jgi:transposase
VKQHEIDAGAKPGTTSVEAARIRELEQEVRELRRAFTMSSTLAPRLERKLDVQPGPLGLRSEA